MSRNLGPNLRQLMKLSRLSQRDVAVQVGVSHQLVSKWTRGEYTPDVYQACALADLFSVPLRRLVDGDPATIRPGRLKVLA